MASWEPMDSISVEPAGHVRDAYRWLRDDLPFGRFLAPVVGYLFVGAVVVWSGRTIWEGIGKPAIQVVGGDFWTINVPQLVVSLAVLLGFYLSIRWVQKQLDRLFEGMVEAFRRAKAEIDQMSQRQMELEARIKKLEPDELLELLAKREFERLWRERFGTEPPDRR
jgi:hypothetical protein